MVGAAGSSPTISADVLAVPRIFTILPAAAIETVPFVLFEIVSPFSRVRSVMSVRAPADEKLDVAVAPKYAELADNIVELALPSEERPVTLSVPPVETFVLMVVAAWAMPALMKTTASASISVRVVLVMLPRYVLKRFI